MVVTVPTKRVGQSSSYKPQAELDQLSSVCHILMVQDGLTFASRNHTQDKYNILFYHPLAKLVMLQERPGFCGDATMRQEAQVSPTKVKEPRRAENPIGIGGYPAW